MSIGTEYGLGVGTLQYWMTDYYQKVKPETKERLKKKVALLKEGEELKKEINVKKYTSYFMSYPKW